MCLDLVTYLIKHGINKTAKRFGVSKCELILRIENLSKALNIQLIEYDNLSDVTITRDALHILSTLQGFLDTIKVHNNKHDKESLSIGISIDSASTWAMGCINNFNKINPMLKLFIIADDFISDTMKNNASIIFWCINDGELNDYKQNWYIEYEYFLFASQDYINKHGIPTISNIHSHTVIAYSGKDKEYDYRGSNWHINGKYGLPVIKPKISVSSREMVARLIANGAGIGSVCTTQDMYYGLDGLVRIFKNIQGPKIKNYFLSKRNMSPQDQANIDLIDSLFRVTLERRGIKINYVA